MSLPSSAAPLVVLLFFAAWPALAQVRPTNKGDGYAQAGGASFGRRQVVATANAATTLFRNAATGAPQCFRVGSLGNIHASNETTTVGTAGGEFVVAFMLAPPGDITMAGDGVTTGDTDTNSACYLTDNNGPDGNGACVTLGPGERIDQVPSYDALIAQIGARLGICTLSLDIDGNPGGPVGFPACANNTDCVTDWGLTGATCDLPGDGSGLDAAGIRARMTESGCAAAVVQTDVDNSIIDWHFDQ